MDHLAISALAAELYLVIASDRAARCDRGEIAHFAEAWIAKKRGKVSRKGCRDFYESQRRGGGHHLMASEDIPSQQDVIHIRQDRDVEQAQERACAIKQQCTGR